VARWTGTWLTGLGSAGVQLGDRRPGERLGLPAQGPGAVAGLGSRVGAFLVDLVVSGLAGSLVNVVVASPTDAQRNLAGYAAFAVLYVVGLALTGQTIGMRLLGLRVRPLPADRPALGLVPALVRTLLLAAFLPAVVSDRNGRGLHDKAARTVVVRTR
jgi:uncharacterized RDD family membrane protein YckC